MGVDDSEETPKWGSAVLAVVIVILVLIIVDIIVLTIMCQRIKQQHDGAMQMESSNGVANGVIKNKNAQV